MATSGEILFVTYIYAMKLIIGENNLIKHFWILNKLEIMQKERMIFEKSHRYFLTQYFEGIEV
jgi:hypothetical protein